MSQDQDRPDRDPVERTARDRFVDGLLRTHHERPLDRERRVALAMKAVRGQARGAGFGARALRQAGGLAAVAAVVAAAFLFTPSQVDAADRARVTAQGERAIRDRRVMFILHPPTVDAGRPSLTGTLDVRDARHMVLTLRRPDGSEVVHGLDGDRAWCVEPSGEVRDEPADHPWPVWIRSPRGGLLVDIAESIESGLSTGWNWKVSKSSTGADQLVAAREGGPRAEPNRLVASIDPQSGRVRSLEIEWPKGGAPAPFEDHAAPRGDRPPPPPHEGATRPPPPRDGVPQRPPPREARADGPMGAPGSMVIVPEPPVTFPSDWFSASSHAPKAVP